MCILTIRQTAVDLLLCLRHQAYSVLESSLHESIEDYYDDPDTASIMDQIQAEVNIVYGVDSSCRPTVFTHCHSQSL